MIKKNYPVQSQAGREDLIQDYYNKLNSTLQRHRTGELFGELFRAGCRELPAPVPAHWPYLKESNLFPVFLMEGSDGAKDPSKLGSYPPVETG